MMDMAELVGMELVRKWAAVAGLACILSVVYLSL